MWTNVAGRHWVPRSWTHDSDAGGSGPAPVTDETLWIPTFQRVPTCLHRGGRDEGRMLRSSPSSDSSVQFQMLGQQIGAVSESCFPASTEAQTRIYRWFLCRWSRLRSACDVGGGQRIDVDEELDSASNLVIRARSSTARSVDSDSVDELDVVCDAVLQRAYLH